MKIQLPLENWADLLPFVPRLQLVEIVKQLGDRQFAKILQFFLTKEGQITLGHLRIVAPRENDPNCAAGPIVEVRKEIIKFAPEWYPLPPSDLVTNLPEGPMPTNVKNFKQIGLSYFDNSVANFLRQFQQQQEQGNSLLDNVNLWFSSHITLSPSDDSTIMAILAKIMPIFGNINSISLRHLNYIGFGSIGLGPNTPAAQLLTTMLTKARILEVPKDMHVFVMGFSACEWLYGYGPRNDGKPRALRLYTSFPNTTSRLIEDIKKDFSKATHAVSFFVYVGVIVSGNVNWQDICLDNAQTKEQLVIKTFGPPPRDPSDFDFMGPREIMVLICRYPMGANPEWIEAYQQEIMEWKFDDQNRRIRFERSLLPENVDNELHTTKVMRSVESNNLAAADDEQIELQQQPQKKITKNIKGRKKEYYFLNIVKTIEELDNIRFKNYCHFESGKPLQILKSAIMPCRRKRNGKGCDFEMMALRSDLKSDNILVYAHSRHNHPLMPEEERLRFKNTIIDSIADENSPVYSNSKPKALMPDANPLTIFRTSDNIEWQFLKTFPDYGKMQQFRHNHRYLMTTSAAAGEKCRRLRYYCNRRYYKNNCQFMLLALKTANNAYHVYKHGEHNEHPIVKPLNKKVRGHHKQQQQNDEEVSEEEDGEDECEEGKDEEEGEGEKEDEKVAIEGEENEGDTAGEEEEDVITLDEEDDKDEAEDDDDDIQVIEHEQGGYQQEDTEGSMEIEIIENPLGKAPPATAAGEAKANPPAEEEKLETKLAKATAKVYNWMAGIEPNEIGQTIGDWDKLSVLKMVEMADQEIREHPQKLNLWLPWLKCAIPKCLTQIEGSNVRYKNLIELIFD